MEDIVFKELDDWALILSNPSDKQFQINLFHEWSEPLKLCRHGRQDQVREEYIEEFIVRAMAWESMLCAVESIMGLWIVWLLDTACIEKSEFYDMFIDIVE